MKFRLMFSVLVASLAATVGCQSNHAIVRGQNPPPNAPPMNAPIGPTPGPIYYNGPAGANSMSCPPYQSGAPWACHPRATPENYWWPTHHHTYDYCQPKNLVYPPQNQPAGVVVYPYYTCKGPSDFFMK